MCLGMCRSRNIGNTLNRVCHKSYRSVLGPYFQKSQKIDCCLDSLTHICWPDVNSDCAPLVLPVKVWPRWLWQARWLKAGDITVPSMLGTPSNSSKGCPFRAAAFAVFSPLSREFFSYDLQWRQKFENINVWIILCKSGFCVSVSFRAWLAKKIRTWLKI